MRHNFKTNNCFLWRICWGSEGIGTRVNFWGLSLVKQLDKLKGNLNDEMKNVSKTLVPMELSKALTFDHPPTTTLPYQPDAFKRSHTRRHPYPGHITSNYLKQ